MSFANRYLEKQRETAIYLKVPPSDKLKYCIVIPAFNEPEIPGLARELSSLNRGEYEAEIIVVVNWPENISPSEKLHNLTIARELSSLSGTNIPAHCILKPDVTNKLAGVGLARKTGMDEAVRRFNLINRPDGIIVSLDADCQVDPNLFTGLDKHYTSNPDTPGCTHYFEHPIQGKEFSPSVYKAITWYELYQRYYLHGLRYAGHPNSFYTVGSAFSVKALDYCSQGGMNLRKAGEDFYFLQKFFDLGTFTECNQIRILPSPRPSDRVPFGTGPVVKELQRTDKELRVFNPELFRILKEFIILVPGMREDPTVIHKPLHPIMKEFLIDQEINAVISEIDANSADNYHFSKRFFRWFNMFRILKFLNFGKKFIPDVPVTNAAAELCSMMGWDPQGDERELLLRFRQKDRQT